MVDIVDQRTRSRMMSCIKGQDTKLELLIRKRLFKLGFRYRLHVRLLPGSPDVVFPKYSAVIFINGCFWHLHGCRFSQLPKTRPDWWQEKLNRNKLRDREVIQRLAENGWRIMVIWECAYRGNASRNNALDRICERASSWILSEEAFAEITGPKSISHG